MPYPAQLSLKAESEIKIFQTKALSIYHSEILAERTSRSTLGRRTLNPEGRNRIQESKGELRTSGTSGPV